jgi:hypothetical protein
MKCKAIEPLIYLVREGELSAGEKAELDRHLTSCENCRKLYDSVTRMTTLIGQSNFGSDLEFSGEEMAETIMNRIEKSKVHGRSAGRTNGYELLIKAVAASFLLFMTLTFIREQTSFNRQRSAMQLRLEESAFLAGNEDPAVDCIHKLERKIRISNRSSFLQADVTAFNQVNEEQLAQYIHDICGQTTGNISRVKQMLQQVGILIKTETN